MTEVKERPTILAGTSGGKYTPEEVRDLEMGLIADAACQEQEEQNAQAAGYCYHCGDTLEDCTGYKCWIR